MVIDDHLRLIIVPASSNPDGEDLFLVFTEVEFQHAKFRGETVLHNRSLKGEVHLSELFGSSVKLC